MTGTLIVEFMPKFVLVLTATTIAIMGISAAITWWENH